MMPIIDFFPFLRTLLKWVSTTRPQTHTTNGPYSLVLENSRFFVSYQTKASPKPQLYYDSSRWIQLGNESFEYLKLNVNTDNEISLDYKVATSTDEAIFSQGKSLRYNATVTYFRLGLDGTLKAFTYDQEAFIQAWTVSLDLLSGSNGLLGWSEKCKPPKLTSSSCDVKKVKYYKIVGLDHFVSMFTKGEGPMKQGDCSKKCTLNCKCAGYFYEQSKSMCWIVFDLMTLTKVQDKKHVGYIKM